MPSGRRYRPTLERRGLTHAVPFDDALERGRSASEALAQVPREALPVARLIVETAVADVWLPRRDLLSSDRFAREFVVEMAGDGTATVRFGDGVRGRKPTPGSRFSAHFRVGNGAAGNVGRDAIKHLILCQIEKLPPKLDLDIYPYLPRANVGTTSAASYMCLVSGDVA